MAEIDDIKRSLTDEQKRIYDVVLGDLNRLKSDWVGCRFRYDEANKVIYDKTTGPKVRLFLKNIAAFWNRRKEAVEAVMETTGNTDLLNEWKKEAYAERK